MPKLRKRKHSKKSQQAVVSTSDKSKFYLSRRNQIIAVIGVAAIGTITLLATHAATPFASLEASSGTVSGGATVVTDSSASGGSYVQFNKASSSGNINSCKLAANDSECWANHTGVVGAMNDHVAGVSNTSWESGQTAEQRTADSAAGNNPNLTLINTSVAIDSTGVWTIPDTSHPTTSRGTQISSGTSLSNKLINGCISIQTDNVTVTNVMVIGNNSCNHGQVSDADVNHSSININYMTIIGGQHTGTNADDSCISTDDGWTLKNIDVSGCGKDLNVNTTVLLQDSYLHDVIQPEGTNDHLDVIFSWDAGTYIHNHLSMGPGDTAYGPTGGYTGAILFHLPNSDPIQMTNNYFDGGNTPTTEGFNIEGPSCGTAPMTITNNVFNPNTKMFGHINDCGTMTLNWTGNVDTSGVAVPEP